jgi:hypothetical protein
VRISVGVGQGVRVGSGLEEGRGNPERRRDSLSMLLSSACREGMVAQARHPSGSQPETAPLSSPDG